MVTDTYHLLPPLLLLSLLCVNLEKWLPLAHLRHAYYLHTSVAISFDEVSGEHTLFLKPAEDRWVSPTFSPAGSCTLKTYIKSIQLATGFKIVRQVGGWCA